MHHAADLRYYRVVICSQGGVDHALRYYVCVDVCENPCHARFMNANQDLERLGKFIAAARRAHFGTVQAAVKAAGVNTATWTKAEHGNNVRPDRMTAIERALGWDLGDADRIAAGGEPFTGRESAGEGLSRYSAEELLDELRARLRRGGEERGRGSAPIAR